jgi:hypothetical protein
MLAPLPLIKGRGLRSGVRAQREREREREVPLAGITLTLPLSLPKGEAAHSSAGALFV